MGRQIDREISVRESWRSVEGHFWALLGEACPVLKAFFVPRYVRVHASGPNCNSGPELTVEVNGGCPQVALLRIPLLWLR